MFQEVILMSFTCPHCGNKNSEIQPGAPVQDSGVRYTFLVSRKEVSVLNDCVALVMYVVNIIESWSTDCEGRLCSRENS